VTKARCSKTPARKNYNKKVGRPSLYTPELADRICLLLARGKSLRKICASKDMPDISTVLDWTMRHEEFFKQYARAREIQAELYADEIIEIADDASGDCQVTNGKAVFQHENVQRSRLRVDARKWILSKLLPKKYGDNLPSEGDGKDKLRELIDAIKAGPVSRNNA